MDNYAFGFWQVEPNIVTQQQFQTWLEEFNLTPELLITYLDRCRFEMVELGKEEKLTKGSAVNWFYGVMKKRGGIYPEPPGYKTIEKLRLEEEEKILAKREKLALRREEVRFKTAFLDMLDNPEGELYQACFNSLSEFEKSLPWESRAFREGMQLQFTSRCGGGSLKQPRINDTPPSTPPSPIRIRKTSSVPSS